MEYTRPMIFTPDTWRFPIFPCLFRNHQAEEITVYVLSLGNHGGKADKKLQKIAGPVSLGILELLDLTDIRDRFDYEIDTRGFDISAMSRLFIGALCQDSEAQVLYLDCDTRWWCKYWKAVESGSERTCGWCSHGADHLPGGETGNRTGRTGSLF